jgi:hypothetical protein
LSRDAGDSRKAQSMTKEHIITGDECWIYWDNNHYGQWATDRAAISPRIRITISFKRLRFRLISLAKDLLLSKDFRKQNDSIPYSSLKQFFQVSFNL